MITNLENKAIEPGRTKAGQDVLGSYERRRLVFDLDVNEWRWHTVAWAGAPSGQFVEIPPHVRPDHHG